MIFIFFTILAYLAIGWLTVPILHILIPDYYSEEIVITLGDLFKFTDIVWYLIIIFWPIMWIGILIQLLKKLSESEIVIWRKKKNGYCFIRSPWKTLGNSY